MARKAGKAPKITKKSFKKDFAQLKVRIFLILNILTCASSVEKTFQLMRKTIFPIIGLMTFISVILNLPSAMENGKTDTLPTCMVMCSGGIQITFRISAICLYVEKIRQLINWFEGMEEDAFWASLGLSVEQRLRRTLHYLNIAIKYIALAFFFTLHLMLLKFYLSDILLFYVPLETRSYKFVGQYFILSTMSIFVFISETLLLVLGFFFVAIINIFLDAVKKLDESEFVGASEIPMKMYQKRHVELLTKLKALETIFSAIQTAQLATSFPMMISTFYFNLESIPNEIIYYIMSINIVVQFFTICLFGEFINSKTEKIFSALYLTRWYDMKKDNQMILMMMMRKSLEPFCLKAAGMYEINMKTFVSVTKLSFSFCAFLYALD
uniref:Odorant receptor n=1 Tax=Lutzomyia longipalpis TaxID=7200 RepID=A0A3F2ZDD6_LUTLO